MNPEFSITTDLAGQDAELAPLFAAFAAAGFSALHWCHNWVGKQIIYDEAFAADVRSLAESHSLRIADVHGFSRSREEYISDDIVVAMNTNRIEFAARAGASAVVLHLPQRVCQTVPEGGEMSTALLEMLRPTCQAHGVRLAIENLPHNRTPNEYFEIMFERFEPDFVGLCYNSGHAVLTGQHDLLARHGDRLLVTHLHDNDGESDQHRLPGAGKADWLKVLGDIKKAGYSGTINLEVHLPDGEQLEEFCKLAYNTIRELWDNV